MPDVKGKTQAMTAKLQLSPSQLLSITPTISDSKSQNCYDS
jgi:hypothetical protein